MTNNIDINNYDIFKKDNIKENIDFNLLNDIDLKILEIKYKCKIERIENIPQLKYFLIENLFDYDHEEIEELRNYCYFIYTINNNLFFGCKKNYFYYEREKKLFLEMFFKTNYLNLDYTYLKTIIHIFKVFINEINKNNFYLVSAVSEKNNNFNSIYKLNKMLLNYETNKLNVNNEKIYLFTNNKLLLDFFNNANCKRCNHKKEN